MFSLGPLILIVLGILMFLADLFMGTIAFIWFGIGFVVVGIIEFFYPIDFFLYEILASFVISGVLMISFKKELNNWIKNADEEVKDDFLNEAGIGKIKNGMVDYKGTYWEYYSKSNKKYDEETKVEVKKIEDNIVYLD